MNIFGRDISLFEKRGKKDNTPVVKNPADNYADDYLMDILDMSKIESLQSFKKLSQDRTMQLNEYDRISEDIVISSALELYADDTCQWGPDGKLIWVEAKEKKVADFANNLIEVLNIPQKLWSVAYSLAKYGDQYIELFTKEEIDEIISSTGGKKDNKNKSDNKDNKDDKDKKDKKENLIFDLGEDHQLERMRVTEEGTEDTKDKKANNKLVETIEVCDDPENIFDLQEFGKTIGFVRVKSGNEQHHYHKEKLQTHNPKKFIHIYLERPSSRKKEIFEAQYKDDENNSVTKEFKVVRGKSMLHDIYQIQQIIQLLEDSLILNRLSKSSILRLLSVEVGDMPRGEVRKLLQRIKSKLEHKMNMNVDAGTYGSHSSPGPIDNMVFLPTRGGKGSIQHDSVGGDVDVRSIVDVDYFVNKKFGGLKIPKQYLGFDEAMPGMGSGLSLTKMDARYGRTIKRIQTAIIRGITALINCYMMDRGMSNGVNNFQVRMVTPTTVEDGEREEILQNRIQIGSSFIMLMNELEGVDKQKMIEFIADYILKEPALKDMIDFKKLKDSENEESEDDDMGF